jgi:hypothetical protein
MILASGSAGAILLGAAALAQASTSYSSYNTTIGKYGGAAYSGNQKKTISDQNAEVISSSVGGSYTADVCLASSGGSLCLGGTKTINDGTKVALWNLAGEGATVKIKFTDGWKWVNVQVTGKWRADKV